MTQSGYSLKGKPRVLYIDDEKDNLIGFKYMFRDIYDLKVAETAREALTILAESHFDVIISDQRMPGMTGVEIFERILPDHPDTVRMILTGYSDIEAVVDAINKGKVYYYFKKPWDETEVKLVIANAMETLCLERRLRRNEEKFRGLIEGSADAIFIVNNAHEILLANDRCEALFGYRREALAGREIGALLPKVAGHLDIAYAETGTTSPSGKKAGIGIESHALKHDGTTFPVDISLSPLKTDEGGIVSISVRDISWRKRAEASLKASEERLKLATRSGNIGVWDWDVERDVLFWDDSMYELYEINKRDFFGAFEAWVGTLHPDDSEHATHAVQQALRGEKKFDTEFRIMTGKGRIKQIHGTATTYLDETGKACRMIGVNMDVTEIRQAEEKILKLNLELEKRVKSRTRELEAEKHFSGKVINSLPGIFYAIDVDGKLVRWNRNYQEITGLSDEELSRHHALDNIADFDRDKVSNAIQTVYREGFASAEVHILTKEGGKVPYYLTGTAVQINKDDYIVGVGIDISERKKIEHELKASKEAAEAATRSKSDFLANMSHEIRTPMNAIIGMNQLLQRTRMTPKQRDYAKKIEKSAGNLLGIINDILDVSKIEAGKLSIEHIDFDLDDVLENVINVVGMKAQSKGLEFLVSKAPELPAMLVGDPLRIGQIILNLANNAVKFTEKGGVVIRVEALERDELTVLLQCSVTDTGIGLTPKLQARVFEAFSQADTSTTREFGGSGLGLSISRQLVEMMGGTLKVDSHPTGGATFTFTLRLGLSTVKPRKQWMLPESMHALKALVVDDNRGNRETLVNFLVGFSLDVEELDSGDLALAELKRRDNYFDLVLMDCKVPGTKGGRSCRKIKQMNLRKQPRIVLVMDSCQQSVMDELDWTEIDGVLMRPVNQSVLFDVILECFGQESLLPREGTREKDLRPPGIEQIRGARVLLVEDNEINQQLAKELLENEGLFVKVVESGADACDILLQGRESYDLVLMDLQMPVMDGYEAARKIRQEWATERLPIIAMSADAMTGVVEKVKAAGMDDYIMKPVDIYEMFKTLIKWVKPGQGGGPSIPASVDKREPAAEEAFTSIEGLNMKEGLSRVAGNRAMYRSFLRTFAEQNHDISARILQRFETGDKATAERMVHTLKGVAGNIGAARLHEAASALEKAIKGQGSEALEDVLDTLQSLIVPLIQNINMALPRSQGEMGLDEESALDSNAFATQLLELKRFIEEGNPAAVTCLQQAREIPGNEGFSHELSKLEMQIEAYAFDDALCILEGLLTMIGEMPGKDDS